MNRKFAENSILISREKKCDKTKNKGTKSDALVKVETLFSDNIEFHEMSMKNNIMKMKKIDGGSIIKSIAYYDNTSANLHNPNTPPQTICAGFNTTDEMFVIYYLYTLYQNGDENLNLDSLMQSGMTNISDLHLENNVDLSI